MSKEQENQIMLSYLDDQAGIREVVFDLSGGEIYACFKGLYQAGPLENRFIDEHYFPQYRNTQGWLARLTNARKSDFDANTIVFSWTGHEPYVKLLAPVIDKYVEY